MMDETRDQTSTPATTPPAQRRPRRRRKRKSSDAAGDDSGNNSGDWDNNSILGCFGCLLKKIACKIQCGATTCTVRESSSTTASSTASSSSTPSSPSAVTSTAAAVVSAAAPAAAVAAAAGKKPRAPRKQAQPRRRGSAGQPAPLPTQPEPTTLASAHPTQDRKGSKKRRVSPQPPQQQPLPPLESLELPEAVPPAVSFAV